MSLPIDNSAIEAQHAAEHEYGERLMDLAQGRAVFAGRPAVLAEDIEWAARRYKPAIDGVQRLPHVLAYGVAPYQTPPKALARRAEVIFDAAQDYLDRTAH